MIKFRFLSSDDCHRPVADFNYVLDLNGSEFLVDVEDSSHVPIRKQVGASAHYLPAPSTYCSKEPDPSFPSALPSSSSVLSPDTTDAPLSSPLANSLSSPMKTPAISLTSAQKRKIRRRKRLLAPAPDQSRCSQWGLLFQCPARKEGFCSHVKPREGCYSCVWSREGHRSRVQPSFVSFISAGLIQPSFVSADTVQLSFTSSRAPSCVRSSRTHPGL